MKRLILTAMALLAVGIAATAPAAEPKLTVLLAGTVEESVINIALGPDGRTYVIDSLARLEVGGDVCWHPEELETELVCAATSIGGFEVNAGGGDDAVVVAREIQIPVTLRGGPGQDRLVGGHNDDKLIGGAGNDTLIGRAGGDSLFGGPGEDRLVGCGGNDVLHGDSGQDILLGGSGQNQVEQ